MDTEHKHSQLILRRTETASSGHSMYRTQHKKQRWDGDLHVLATHQKYKESVIGNFEDITDIILGGNDSSDEESSKEEAPGEEVNDVTISGEEEATVE